MNYLQRIEHWGDRHHPRWMDLVRIVLGIFLIIKGIEFMNNMGAMLNLMASKVSNFGDLSLMLLGHFIVFAHLVGGLLLAAGIFTRFASLLQIPIVLGAIIFINSSPQVFKPFSELTVSILVLIGLIYFAIAGNGPWSLEWVFDEKKRPERTE